MKKRIVFVVLLALLAAAVAIPLQAAFADSPDVQNVMKFVVESGKGFVVNPGNVQAGIVKAIPATGAQEIPADALKAGPCPKDVKVTVRGQAKGNTPNTKSAGAVLISCGGNPDGKPPEKGQKFVTEGYHVPPPDSLKEVPCSNDMSIQITDANDKPIQSDAPFAIQCFEAVPNK